MNPKLIDEAIDKAVKAGVEYERVRIVDILTELERLMTISGNTEAVGAFRFAIYTARITEPITEGETKTDV